MIADAHCDTLMQLVGGHPTGSSLTEHLPGHLDLPRLLGAGVGLQFFALFSDPADGPGLALRRILEMIARFHASVQASGGRLYPVLRAADAAPQDGRVGGLLSVEGLGFTEGSLAIVQVLHMLGVRSAMLTWNERNGLADGALATESGGALSREGVAVVREMQRLHMLLDASHLGERGFWSLLEVSEGPLIASHSNAHALCAHPRNLRDDQLRAIADRGGVVGLNFHAAFLVPQGDAALGDVVHHARHIADRVGAEHVGLGSDFDGIPRGPAGLETVAAYPNLRPALALAGFSSGEQDGILGGNLRRVLQAVLA